MEKSIRVYGKLLRKTTVQKCKDQLASGVAAWKVADKFTGGNHAVLALAIKMV